MTEPRVLLVGQFGPGDLPGSYARAFRDLGALVETFDIHDAVDRYTRVPPFGRAFNRFVPVEPWILKANRELILAARRFQPTLLVAFGQSPFRPGPLAQIVAQTGTRLVLVWPDSLLECTPAMVAALPVFDLVASYSEAAVDPLKRLGARRATWVPFAGDLALHSAPEAVAPIADVGFIGSWRPERGAAVSALFARFPALDLKIWGPEWGRHCASDARIMRAWQKRPAFGADFARIVTGCRISLNVIDETNYPGANMRFFEIPTAGGLQLSSPCPEMSSEFPPEETTLYYRDHADLCDTVERVLADVARYADVRHHARARILERHTYRHRAAAVLDLAR